MHSHNFLECCGVCILLKLDDLAPFKVPDMAKLCILLLACCLKGSGVPAFNNYRFSCIVKQIRMHLKTVPLCCQTSKELIQYRIRANKSFSTGHIRISFGLMPFDFMIHGTKYGRYVTPIECFVGILN